MCFYLQEIGDFELMLADEYEPEVSNEYVPLAPALQVSSTANNNFVERRSTSSVETTLSDYHIVHLKIVLSHSTFHSNEHIVLNDQQNCN